MRACRLTRPAPIEAKPIAMTMVEDPRPAAGEILIRIRACGLCRTDLHVVEGDLEIRKPHVIPGHQIVGEVIGIGEGAAGFAPGDRAGVAWLNRTCGACGFCSKGRENLCARAEFTGWTVDGGYAERIAAPAAFAYRIPDRFDDAQAAPLLCAGIIGWRALRLTDIEEWEGARLGLYGFGAAGHVAIQIARARGAEVHVVTRDRAKHQRLAAALGAAWVGGNDELPPVPLDAAVIFAPAGDLVPKALAAIARGGTLVLGGIHMSPIPSIGYDLIYGERTIRSVANNTREDGRLFLEEAARIPVTTSVTTFPLEEANEALAALKNDGFRGSGVLAIADA